MEQNYANRPGSVSNVLKRHRDEIFAIENFNEAKKLTIDLIYSEAKTSGTTAFKYIDHIANKVNNLKYLHNYINAVIKGGEKYSLNRKTDLE